MASSSGPAAKQPAAAEAAPTPDAGVEPVEAAHLASHRHSTATADTTTTISSAPSISTSRRKNDNRNHNDDDDNDEISNGLPTPLPATHLASTDERDATELGPVAHTSSHASGHHAWPTYPPRRPPSNSAWEVHVAAPVRRFWDHHVRISVPGEKWRDHLGGYQPFGSFFLFFSLSLDCLFCASPLFLTSTFNG